MKIIQLTDNEESEEEDPVHLNNVNETELSEDTDR